MSPQKPTKTEKDYFLGCIIETRAKRGVCRLEPRQQQPQTSWLLSLVTTKFAIVYKRWTTSVSYTASKRRTAGWARADTPKDHTQHPVALSASTPLVLFESATYLILHQNQNVYFSVLFQTRHQQHSGRAYRGYSLRNHDGCRGRVLVGKRCHIGGGTARPVALRHNNRFFGSDALYARTNASRLLRVRCPFAVLCAAATVPRRLVWHVVAKI